jgi:hypothetical protein
VLHGESDRIAPLAEATKLYERVGAKRKHIGDWLLANM